MSDLSDRYTNGKDGKWITVKGRHVFIERGESVETAMQKIRGKVYFDAEKEETQKPSEKPLTDDKKNDTIKQNEDLSSYVKEKLSSIRDTLKRDGKAQKVIYTWNYQYIVEIYDDDEYSYKVIGRKEIK